MAQLNASSTTLAKTDKFLVKMELYYIIHSIGAYEANHDGYLKEVFLQSKWMKLQKEVL